MRKGKCGRPRTGARRPSRPSTPPESLAAWSPVPTPGIYEIRCHGEIDARWTDWFDGLSVRHPGDGTTVITGFFEAGAALMDIWGPVARRAFGIKGLDHALLGRWIGHIGRGRFSHQSIAAAEPIRGERALGWIEHYSIGIAFALLLLAVQGPEWAHAPTPRPALLTGWATLIAPWLILQPGTGAGIAASKTPHPRAARLRNVITLRVPTPTQWPGS